jgi:hypothetical protein
MSPADFVRVNRHHADGQRTTGAYIGDALRHSRRAAELNLSHGPTPGVADAVQRAKKSLDRAAWLCEYIAAESER